MMVIGLLGALLLKIYFLSIGLYFYFLNKFIDNGSLIWVRRVALVLMLAMVLLECVLVFLFAKQSRDNPKEKFNIKFK